MCDYSLMGVPNRLATEGEDLFVHRFPTGSMGLTASRVSSPVECSTNQAAKRGFWTVMKEWFTNEGPQQAVAACIPPGARLLVRDIPEDVQHSFKSGPTELVTFTQLSAAENAHRDAIRLHSGAEILLQRLREGQRVRVLQLSAVAEQVVAVPSAAHVR